MVTKLSWQNTCKLRSTCSRQPDDCIHAPRELAGTCKRTSEIRVRLHSGCLAGVSSAFACLKHTGLEMPCSCLQRGYGLLGVTICIRRLHLGAKAVHRTSAPLTMSLWSLTMSDYRAVRHQCRACVRFQFEHAASSSCLVNSVHHATSFRDTVRAAARSSSTSACSWTSSSRAYGLSCDQCA